MEIILGVVMFTLIVLVLSGLILAARSKLVNAGDVVIEINNEADKQIRTPAGDKLLNTLSSNGIFVSSACGGGGSCGQCRVTIKEGGGDILPTDNALLATGQLKSGQEYDFDFDYQFIETEKYDAKPTYKQAPQVIYGVE